MKDNVPIEIVDGKQTVKAINGKGQEVTIDINDGYNSRTNPVTGQVIFQKNGEQFKTGYKARKEFETKHIPDTR